MIRILVDPHAVDGDDTIVIVSQATHATIAPTLRGEPAKWMLLIGDPADLETCIAALEAKHGKLPRLTEAAGT